MLEKLYKITCDNKNCRRKIEMLFAKNIDRRLKNQDWKIKIINKKKYYFCPECKRLQSQRKDNKLWK